MAGGIRSPTPHRCRRGVDWLRVIKARAVQPPLLPACQRDCTQEDSYAAKPPVGKVFLRQGGMNLQATLSSVIGHHTALLSRGRGSNTSDVILSSVFILRHLVRSLPQQSGPLPYPTLRRNQCKERLP